ncbi:uncharacterized protein LOC126968985 [Leptidea sinapis]|uniref:DRBM domain-containing protein n=1 Tax=Leptidea sinapis TaxID=189913 RepID=A0A5E4R3V3_9NEOP|nr:uncharacterized protein LOC126968985 [Leptidea sinapis]XP_050670204.1 uncharacterized protein LOC126968985 [Leptidea sinapis]XP_050670206.1 uncharacterized protein LOC126968985 [Leptidea sinapis]VVD04664.1 unnamed protein product [Leptidea sinapis]
MDMMQVQKMEHDVESQDEKTQQRIKKFGITARKLSLKERRRRRNQRLRRQITPKSALMVLNEMKQGEQITNLFKVTPVQMNHFGKLIQQNYEAECTIDGVTYKGYGDTKSAARNNAAEQAVRDLVIKCMERAKEPAPNETAATDESMEQDEDTGLPMAQLASYALFKLFSEWEQGGYKVPLMRTPGSAGSESDGTVSVAPGAGPKERQLPPKALEMHPCMLLTYMRPHQVYRELQVEGRGPPNLTFTVGVDVDGHTFTGKAGNKKEARRRAAIAACKVLFDIHFEE